MKSWQEYWVVRYHSSNLSGKYWDSKTPKRKRKERVALIGLISLLYRFNVIPKDFHEVKGCEEKEE